MAPFSLACFSTTFFESGALFLCMLGAVMRKLILSILAIASFAVAVAQESKLNYVATLTTKSIAICGAYELFSAENVFGRRGLFLKGRVLGGIGNANGGTVTGGGDLVLALAMADNAEGSAGLGGVIFAGDKGARPCLTLGIKIYPQSPSRPQALVLQRL